MQPRSLRGTLYMCVEGCAQHQPWLEKNCGKQCTRTQYDLGSQIGLFSLAQIAQRDYTLEELREFNGVDNPKILVGVCVSVWVRARLRSWVLYPCIQARLVLP